MKDFRSIRPRVGPKSQQVDQQEPVRAEAEMQTDAPIRKSGGRLSREDQRRLGNILQKVYDDVVRQGVPDRFRDLLSELDNRVDSETTVSESASSPRHGESGHDSEPGRVVEANPGSKGSH